MAQEVRSGVEPGERVDAIMTDNEPTSRKEQLLLDVQKILDVDEEAGGLQLDGFLTIQPPSLPLTFSDGTSLST